MTGEKWLFGIMVACSVSALVGIGLLNAEGCKLLGALCFGIGCAGFFLTGALVESAGENKEKAAYRKEKKMAAKTTVNRFVALAISLLTLGIASMIISVVLFETKYAGLAMAAFVIGAMLCVTGLVIGDVVGKVVMADDAIPQSESNSVHKQVR